MPLEPHPTDPKLMVYRNRQYDLPKPWVGLTNQEFQKAVDGLEDLEDCWIAIEAKLKEKNT